MALTPTQAAAVAYEKNLILFAGPGSGKTSTSVTKGFHILSNPDYRLCMVSFTAASAAEMRERLDHKFREEKLQPPGNRLLCGTFHALALRHYQKHARNAKKLIAPPARYAMVNAMLGGVDPGERGEFQLALDRYQGALDQANVEFSDERHRSFVMEYHKRLVSSNSTDLAMTMRDCATHMSSGDIPLFPISHMLGDEFQDADEIQLEMVLAHTRQGVITTLVGDDDQCIYEWRSALGYAGMQRFARESGAKTIALGENFRSREEIVAHANALIAYNNPNRIDKNQKATRGPGGVVGYEGFADIKHQSEFVARYVELTRKEGESVAVLARTNADLGYVGRALHAKSLPYEKEGKTLWDIPSIAILLSTLQGIWSGRTGDMQPLFAIFPISLKVRRELETFLGDDASAFLDGRVPTLTSATEGEQQILQKASKAFSIWRSQNQKNEVDLMLPQISDCLYDWTSLHLAMSRTQERTQRSQLAKIRTALDDAELILTSLRGNLRARLNTLQVLKEKEMGPDAVHLMTMHASKGLEYDTVFLVNANDPEDGSLFVAEESERRLFFVAVTRAKERFFALYSDTPSPFIAEADLPQIGRSLAP